MKHLFFVAVAVGILSGTSISVKAQTSVNVERLTDRAKPKISLKFIENIEIVPEAASNKLDAIAVEKTTSETIGSAPLFINTALKGNIEHCSALQFKYGMMMNMDVEGITNFSLYNFIDQWWATKYQYGGNDETGIDCSAFTGKLLSTVYGMSVPRTAKDQYALCEKMATEDLVEGDLVFFNTRGGVSHVGLYLGNNYFVHSSVSAGVTISSLTDDYYSKKFISGGRIIKQ